MKKIPPRVPGLSLSNESGPPKPGRGAILSICAVLALGLPACEDGSETTGDETTVDVTATGDVTTGGQSTGDDPSTGGEEGCPQFTSVPDADFDALLAEMQLKAVSPSLRSPLPSGLSVAIVVDGELRHAGGVGTRAKEGHPLADEPVDAETMFRIASTSKWIHGAMMSSLVEDGLLDFHTPVTDVLPDYTETKGLQADIRLHHLLTMTSGLYVESTCLLQSVSESLIPLGCAMLSEGPGTVLERLFDPATLAIGAYKKINSTTYGAPGEAGFNYCNWGIMLSGRMAEVAGGAAYPDLVAARVFEPAKMCTATYEADDVSSTQNYAVGTGSDDWSGVCPEPELGHDSQAPWEPDELSCRARDPNGGVWASAVDVGRFAAAILGDLAGAGTMLGQATAHRMLCPDGGTFDDGCQGRVPTGEIWGDMDSYGYTNFHQNELGYDVYSHGGSRPGFGALFWLVPERNFAVVILANEENTAYDAEPWGQRAIDCWLNHKC